MGPDSGPMMVLGGRRWVSPFQALAGEPEYEFAFSRCRLCCGCGLGLGHFQIKFDRYRLCQNVEYRAVRVDGSAQ